MAPVRAGRTAVKTLQIDEKNYRVWGVDDTLGAITLWVVDQSALPARPNRSRGCHCHDADGRGDDRVGEDRAETVFADTQAIKQGRHLGHRQHRGVDRADCHSPGVHFTQTSMTS